MGVNNTTRWQEHLAKLKSQKTKPAGLGDTIARITSAIGIKPCGGCKKRQEKLNKLVPYGINNSDK